MLALSFSCWILGILGFLWWEWCERQATKGILGKVIVTAVYRLVWKHFYILATDMASLCVPAKHTQRVSSQAPQSDLRLLSPRLRAFNMYTRKCLAFWSLWKVLW